MAKLLFRVYLVQIMSGLVAMQVWSSSDFLKCSPVYAFSEVYVKCCVS
jgi:hypothetical protein